MRSVRRRQHGEGDGDDGPGVPVVVAPDADRGEEQEPAEGDRDEDLPAEVHQLVVAHPRERRAQPHVDVQEHERLEQEPDGSLQRARDQRDVERRVTERDRLWAAEEERDDHRAHRDRAHELGEVEQPEADARVLGVEPTDQLLLRLDEVERWTAQLGGHRDHEDDERHDRGGDDVPVGQRVLFGDDARRRQRAGGQDHRGQAQAERSLVADHLGGRPHRAEQRVLRAARPPGEHVAVDRDRRHREHEQDPDGRIGQLHSGLLAEPGDDAVAALAEVAAERDDRPDEEGRHEGEVRGEPEHRTGRPGPGGGPP